MPKKKSVFAFEVGGGLRERTVTKNLNCCLEKPAFVLAALEVQAIVVEIGYLTWVG